MNLESKKSKFWSLLSSKGIGLTIAAIKDFVHESSSKFKTLLLIESHYNALRIRQQQGILSYEVISLEENRARKNLLDFIDDLELQDGNYNQKDEQKHRFQNDNVVSFFAKEKRKIEKALTTREAVSRFVFYLSGIHKEIPPQFNSPDVDYDDSPYGPLRFFSNVYYDGHMTFCGNNPPNGNAYLIARIYQSNDDRPIFQYSGGFWTP